MKQQAENYLKKALNNPDADFRDGQWESIEQLLNKNRVLVVQRTGWGKSMVYFLAAKLLRDQGFGPTLLISPLLSLMRNQLEAAQRIGVTGRTINSTNNEDWEKIQEELNSNKVDVLLISPERLSNENFSKNILSKITSNLGLFVIDEAHCISDWGHDFRPDYRRIVRILHELPKNIPVLATTATANNRVVNDIKSQLGQDLIIQRGSLVRKSLKLQNIVMPGQDARMAWLAKTVPALPGSGIIYTLTQRDAERVAKWLQLNKINAKPYHANISFMEEKGLVKEELEKQLLNNEIKVLVATVALGMGFDKPDLGFVIHFQRPASVVHYYQQVGRAGRAVDEAYAILLCGEEDDRIANHFIKSAFPPQQHIIDLLKALNESEKGLSVLEIQRYLNLRKNQIDKTIKFLTVESPSPIIKTGSKWKVQETASNYKIDQDYIDTITGIRFAEQKQMHEYMNSSGCLMSFLQKALDEPSPIPCGKCKNCASDLLLDETYDKTLANKAALFLRGNYQLIKPRKQWPSKNMFSKSPLGGYKIPETLQAEEGQALSIWRDAGWGKLVAESRDKSKFFPDNLVEACVKMIEEWAFDPSPKWITCIPSLNNPDPVHEFTARLANQLKLPFIPCIEKVQANSRQKDMENSFMQVKNLDGVFNVNLKQKKYHPCILIDDTISSGWTFTVASALLRKSGCTAVYPMALALNSPRMD